MTSGIAKLLPKAMARRSRHDDQITHGSLLLLPTQQSQHSFVLGSLKYDRKTRTRLTPGNADLRTYRFFSLTYPGEQTATPAGFRGSSEDPLAAVLKGNACYYRTN